MTLSSLTVLTLDAGGTTFAFQAIRDGKEAAPPLVLPSRGDNLEACLDCLLEGFTRMKKAAGGAEALSFAFPGPADYAQGIIGDQKNLPAFQGGVALGPFLEDSFHLPVFIHNDGDLFTLGEARYGLLPEVNRGLEEAGSPRRHRNLLGLTFGTGFGAGLVLDGRLHLGDNGAGAEIWCLRHRLERNSFAEEGVSIRALKRVYAEEAGLNPSEVPEPREIAAIARWEQPGDARAAREAWRRLGQVAGDAAASALSLVDGLLVIGGGLSAAQDLFLPAFLEELSSPYPSLSKPRMQARTELTVFHLDDAQGFRAFLGDGSRELTVPRSRRTVKYDPVKRTGVGLSRLGTAKAVALGAYAYAVERLG